MKRETLTPFGWVLYVFTPLAMTAVIYGAAFIAPIIGLVTAACVFPLSVRAMIEIGERYARPLQ